ncbi:MAG: hypothetical protein OYH77_03045 [Pseudomonadota bacterium]|nr:hypothetical protein [Pseudomonadota bacterium]
MKRLFVATCLALMLFGFDSSFNCEIQISQLDMQYAMYAGELGEKGMRLYQKDRRQTLQKIKKQPEAVDQVCNEFFIRWTPIFKKLEQQMLNF